MDHSDSFNSRQSIGTTTSDENVQLLKCMGFLDENEIRQALEIAKNDLNEALTILTSEKAPYLDDSDHSKTSNLEMDLSDQHFDHTKFPLECLVALESNLYSDNWTVSFNKNEWLDRLLKSSIYFTGINRFQDSDEANNYSRFVTKSLPEYFKKLLESTSVNKWSDKIQQGVHSMILLCLDLIQTKLKSTKRDNLDIFLDLLASIFNPKIEFNRKNSYRLPSVQKSEYQREQPNGWIIDFINEFANLNGFDNLIKLIETSDLNESNLILKPIALCIEYLNELQLKLKLEEPFKVLIQSLSNIESLGQFKNKNSGRIFELIDTMKKLSLKLWPDDVSNFNELHLKIVLSMLKNSNFNSKMNSLKEICKLIDNSKTFMTNSAPINEDFLGTWLVNEQILSFAIEGNLDQAQYCDKLKSIVEFLGNRISHDEIKTLWQMQFNKPSSIVDNLYSLISIVTSKFNQEQLDDLIGFIKSTWNDPSFKSHDRLVYLLRLIGQESKNSKTHLKILDALWSLKDQSASTHPFLIQLIYKEHLSVLNTDRVYRDQAKSVYIKKCLGLIDQENKLGALYALKHLFDILNSYKTKSWPSVKSLRDVLGEIVVPEIKTICQNLINYNQFRAQFANTIFSHEQIINLHLNLLKFALKEGNLYLRLVRAEEIWDSLTESNDELNVQKCFEWFIECIVDLNEQTRNEMFRQRVTKLDPTKLTLKGYECYRLFFLYHNQSESRVQITSSDSSDFLVEESDLDLDYLWKLILNNDSDQIVHKSVEFLLKLCCSNLAPSLKRDVHTFNTKLIQTIFEKIKQNESKETQLNNLLKCLEEFIRIFDTKEEAFCLTSHSSSIKIDKISVKVQVNENKECLEVKNLYSNDLLESLRQKIAELVNNSVNNFQLLHESKILAQSLDNKTLSSLEINDASLLTCKLIPSTPVKSSEFFTTLSNSSTPNSSLFSNRLSISCPNEIKKHLPSVILSSNQESYAIFDKLLNHKNSLIASRTRNILNLIPTNSQLVDLFDSIVLFDSNQSSLAQFFSQESNSLIKILYNLEVLSIRIINDENFKQKFINKTGLNLLIDIFESVIDTDENLVEQLLILLINLVDYVLLDQSEPMVKKSLVCINSKLIDLLLKTFIKKSTNLNFNSKISVKSINLVYNLICSNLNQIDSLIESSLFRTNIVNVLIGAKCSQIRHNLAKFFTRMSNLNETIKYKLIILILKNTRVPIWTNSTKHMRSSARNLISQSSEYFTLLSNLIENMSPKLLSMDSENELNAENLLKNQINWFRMFNLSSNLDQVLLNGQFGLTKAILTNCSSQIKDSYGAQLTDILIKLFLFQPFFSSCGMILEQQTQQVGYDLLLELTKKSKDNFSRIKAYVCQFNQENKISECNFTPLVKSFKQKYLGLKNGGSTCYMNAVLQQLFMIPGICEYIQFMNNSNASRDLNHEKQLLFELENVFVHLKKSNQEFYSPERFWQNFRMWNSGDSINIREQQDAFDFFISLTDQIDEYIQKELKKEPVFKSLFEGKYSNQFICQDCEHSYDRQEAFLALNLSVKTFSNLEQSMAQFVKDELLTGDNSYLCEKCNKKRSAIKRTCLKQLPNYLCIQLKRFDYDWESNQALKFDDYFEFPVNLNVKPFTHDYLNKINSHSIDCDYELCGIIVHSGQANAGHYYSFIKELFNSDDLMDEEASDTNASKWFKFNDTYIDEIKIDEKFLIEECFGGNFNKKDSYFPEVRTRYWNAYMLFYKRKSFDSKSLFKVDDLNRKNEDKIQFRDSISELSDLVEQCDHKVKEYQLDKEIRIENLNLLKQNLIVNETYCDFVFSLVEQNLNFFTAQTIDLIFNFLFCIYFKLKNKLRNNFSLKKWFDLFDNNSTRQICIHIVEFFGQSINLELLKSHLADNAVDKEIHEFITSLIILIINRMESEHQLAILDSLMESLFSLVTNSLLNTNLNSVFKIIYSYVCSKDENVHAFLEKQKLFEQKLIDLICKSSLLQLKNFHILFEIVSVIELKKFGLESNIFDDNVTVKQFIGVFEYINKDHLEHTLQLIKKFCNSEASCLMFIKQILLYLDESCLLQVDSRQIFELIEEVILISDDTNLKRLQTCMQGEDNSVGLLTVIRNNLSKDPKKSYDCIKLIVTLANKNCNFKEYLLNVTSSWEWSVSWLKTKMSENNFESATFSPNSSNIQSSKKLAETKTFQRTKSAQTTLEHAMDLLSSNSLDV